MALNQHALIKQLGQIGQGCKIDPHVIIEEPENIFIGNNVTIKAGVVLCPTTGNIVIGDNVTIDYYTTINGKGGVEIGSWCVIEPHVEISTQKYSYSSFKTPIQLQEHKASGITLMGDNWIGANSVILDNVTLGKGTIVNAGAIVTESFPMAVIIAGNPAKKISNRKSEKNWQFETEERFSALKTPKEYFNYVHQRIQYGISYLKNTDIVLDVGCGEGYITNHLSQYCQRIIGIDYSLEAIKTASDLYDLDFFQMNVTNLEFDDELFDKIICFELIEHLTHIQAQKTLMEIYRVLKKDGLLIGSTPIRQTKESNPRTYAHIYEYSAPELKILLKDFELLELKGTFLLAKK
jgi:acetyltransferase-like isoleucine patch superfamily enzyme/ubiquinone/menaquinone biosynthesis C-methylase UbiE